MNEKNRKQHHIYDQFANTKYDDRNIFDACTHGDFPLVVLLWGMAMANPALNHYDLYNTSDENENTILHYAAASPTDSVDIVHFLLQQLQLYFQQVVELQMAHNDILNARNAFYETPLIRAAHEGNLRVVHNLCMMPDIDILAADSLGNTAAHHAAVMGHIDTLHYLLECEKLAKNKGLKLMLEEPTKPLGGVDEYGRDVLHHAVENEQIVLAQYVLSRGDFDIMRADESNLTPRKKAESAPLMRELDLDTKSPLKVNQTDSNHCDPVSIVYMIVFTMPLYTMEQFISLVDTLITRTLLVMLAALVFGSTFSCSFHLDLLSSFTKTTQKTFTYWNRSPALKSASCSKKKNIIHPSCADLPSNVS
ncbi:unnamed protein product [Albugo candida]|nr:unnamed protein product [Albugo candida]|eukprot:CCI50552.1 unnamed protein product [Albugo candida]